MLSQIELAGVRAKLEPLTLEHAPALWDVARAPEIWSFFPRPLQSLRDVEAFIGEALDGQHQGVQLPFAIRDLELGRLVGSTRFADYSAPHRSAEIGWTWLSPAVWRTRINTECKFLLLKHGFEVLNLQRIFFKTDARNGRSQRAIERIGAQKEGTFRKHRICADGFVRDSIYYSIIDDEWPDIKAKLQKFLLD